MLTPHSKDVAVEFESDFTGMTNREVTLEQLLEVRERLFRELPASLDEQERYFLVSIHQGEPNGKLIGLPEIENLPAIRWKLLNLQKLAKSNMAKHAALMKSLLTTLKRSG